MPTTSLPLSARQVLVTSPTYPVPITAIFKKGLSSRSGEWRGMSKGLQALFPRHLSLATRHSLAAVLPLVVFQVFPRPNVVHPVRVVEIPGDRLAQPLLEGDRGPPAEFGLDLAAVDG